eukprot:COSAG01_NODE_21538_length_897_cov_1.543860_1_plen_159_part_00
MLARLGAGERKKRLLRFLFAFRSLSYICPEPVLTNHRFSSYNTSSCSQNRCNRFILRAEELPQCNCAATTGAAATPTAAASQDQEPCRLRGRGEAVQDGKLCLVLHQESRLQLVQRVQHHQRHWQSNRRLRVGGKCLPPFSVFPCVRRPERVLAKRRS